MLLWIGIGLVGFTVAVVNATVTRRIWRSGAYERGQLIAQTTLIWLLPGSAFAVAFVLKGDSPGRALDPTASNSDTPNANATAGARSLGAP